MGLVCAGVNSVFTMVWLLTGEASTMVRHHAKGSVPVFLFMGGVILPVTLLPAVVYLYKTFYGPQSLSHWNTMIALIQNYLLPIGMLMLLVGIVNLVATTTLFSIVELCNRLKRSTPSL